MNDPTIIKLKNSRNISCSEAHQSSNPSTWDKFKEDKRAIKKAMRRAKSSFYRKALSINNPKEVWKILHGILHPPAKRSTFKPAELNKYFATIANVTLKKKAVPRNETTQFINSLPETQKDDDSDSDSGCFHLQHTSYEHVLKQLKLLRNDTSTGPDEIPTRFVKMVDEIICSPLTHIINTFIENNKFPTLWKAARIVPINKVTTPTEKSHFRPIAILPALSKVFERIVCNQLIEFIDNRQIYKDTVTGFRKGFSTGSALLKLRDDIKKAMNASELSIIVLIDFSKAFDTISHDTLVKTLHKYGFSREFLHWTLSYLSGRRQYVQLDSNKSKFMTTYFGVPQGSILGPLLFNLYVNDLKECFPSKSIQYADDTTIYESCRPSNIQNAVSKLNETLTKLETWSNDNSLAINAVKSKYFICSSKKLHDRHHLSDISVSLSMGEMLLDLESNPRLLGIYLDKHLDWSNQLQEIISSCYGKISVLKKLKNFTTFKLRKQLAECLILSKIDFNDHVFSPLTNAQINKLQRLQKAAASFVFGRYVSTKDILKLRWLPVEERRVFNCMKLAYKAIHHENWPTINKLEIKTTGRMLRNSNELKLTPSMINGTFQDQTSKEFNRLPSTIRHENTLSSFCNSLEKELFKRASDRLIN